MLPLKSIHFSIGFNRTIAMKWLPSQYSCLKSTTETTEQCVKSIQS